MACTKLAAFVGVWTISFLSADWAEASPDYGSLFDAQLEQRRGAFPAIRVLRVAQQRAGNHPVLLGNGWSNAGDEVLAFYRRLPDHGLSAGADLQTVAQEVASGRDYLLKHTTWRVDPVAQPNHFSVAARTEYALAELVLRIAVALDSIAPQSPESVYLPQARVLHALSHWLETNQFLATLLPCGRDYYDLVGALANYRSLLSRGGFLAVPRKVKRAKPGKNHEAIAILRKRLAQEDAAVGALPEGVTNDQWDSSLTAALRRARTAYQLYNYRSKRRLIDRRLLAALKVPVASRIAAIEYGLRRLRKSPFNRYLFAVRVNLPEYYGEVWDGPARIHRFKVVVGAKGGRRMINRTPEIESKIHTVVYNPTWVPPKRIYKRELLPKAERWLAEGQALGEERNVEDYWRKRGFKLMNKKRPPNKQWLKRKPGWGNPLGRVKMLFENRYAVYMHDTPQKSLFRKVMRAASHGCVRVHKPLNLAELLLKRDGTWEVAEKKRVLKHYKLTEIRLREPIPVVLDYIPTRVGHDGRVRFMADIYRQVRVSSR